MQPRPVIGIATQTLNAIPGELPPCWVMGQRYVRALTAAGAVPWVIPLLPGDEATLRAIYERLDGVFLTGGVDVEPSFYGEAKLPVCGTTDPDPVRRLTRGQPHALDASVRRPLDVAEVAKGRLYPRQRDVGRIGNLCRE